MNLGTNSNVITLDWDDITYDDALSRCNFIFDYHIVKSVQLRQSGLSGYHCIVHLYIKGNVLRLRRLWKDDGRRIVNDIFNRPDYIHDVLWNTKNLYGIKWESHQVWQKSKSEQTCLL